MPTLTGAPMSLGQNVFFSSARAEARPGTIGTTADGRTFRYAKAGALPLVAGNALQARAQNALHADIACRATPIGSSEIYITTNATTGALAANEYQGGLIIVDTAPGLGGVYVLSSHDAIAASSPGTLALDNDTVQIAALTTASRVTLIANPYTGVIQHPVTTATGMCVGGCVYPVAANQYGWIQTGGPGAALIAGTPAVGVPLTSVGATPGALSAATGVLPHVAFAAVTGRAAKVCAVYWTID